VTPTSTKLALLKERFAEPDLSNNAIALIDPPWAYSDECRAGNRGAKFKYPVLTTDDILRLDVPRLLAKDAAVFLWVTAPFLRDGFMCLDAWGLRYSTVAFVWVKTSGVRSSISTYGGDASGLAWGMGASTRANAEFVLLGRRGSPKRVNAGIHSVVIAPRLEHSAKPKQVREAIVDLMGPVKRVELFARERVPGWDAIGNDIDGRDIREVLGMRPESVLEKVRGGSLKRGGPRK
jgi:N6-adenosine-specific RNA methylase IME4